MDEIEPCLGNYQHCWVLLPKTKGMPSHSCPTCGQLVYWSDILLSWVKPGTCPNCGGQGWTTEHDAPASHYDGECHSCPVQAPCEYCQGTGKVDYKKAPPIPEGSNKLGEDNGKPNL